MTDEEVEVCLEAIEAYGARGCVHCGHSRVQHRKTKKPACKKKGCDCPGYFRPTFDEILSRVTPGYAETERDHDPVEVARYHRMIDFCCDILVAQGRMLP